MSRSISRWLAPAALSVAVVGSAFQPFFCIANPLDSLDPLDPKAKVPALIYESSFARYRSYGEAKPIGWREANDTVNRIGGWRAYAREAQPADAPAEPTPRALPANEEAKPPATPPATPGHGSHKSH